MRGMLRPLVAAYRQAYAGLPRGAWVLALVCFVHRSGTMVLPFLALYLTSERGMSPAGAGIVLSLYGAGSGLGAFWGGRLTDRFGARRVQVASLALAGGGFLLLGQLDSVAAIRVAAFLLAATGEAFRPANAAAFTYEVASTRWAQALALRRLALNLGMTCGPALGGLLAVRDYGLLFLVDGTTCLVAAALLALLDRSPAPAAAPAGGGSGPTPWRDGAFVALLACSTAFAAVLYQFFATYPLTLRDRHGFDETRVGSVYAINTLMIVALEMLLVQRLASRSPLRTAAWGSLLFCGGIALVAVGHGYAFVAATVVVWTVGEMLAMPFLETTVAARGDRHNRGSYLGAYNLAFSISFAAAPLLGTAVYQRHGPVPLWAGCAAIGAVLWLVLRLLAGRLAAGAPVAPRPAAAAPPA